MSFNQQIVFAKCIEEFSILVLITSTNRYYNCYKLLQLNNVLSRFNSMSLLETFVFTPNYKEVHHNTPITLNPNYLQGSEEEKSSVLTQNFLQIRNAELDIINNLIPTDEYTEDENGDLVYQADIGLPAETSDEIDSIMHLLKDNILINDINELRKQCNITFRTKTDTINNLNDVFELDPIFIDGISNYECFGRAKTSNTLSQCVVCVNGPSYYGSVWTFTNSLFPNMLGMYAIRGSVLNLLAANCVTDRKGIAMTLLTSIVNMAKMGGKTKIVVPWPLEPMRPILIKFGFIEINTNSMTTERQFLNPIAGTTNYFTLDIVN